jgi:oligoribonuclease NrnB/cAMP/cGMP phosphodiesterase (DHH superfamily)
MNDESAIRDKLLSVTDVYFHEGCPDGTASAMICAYAFGRMINDIDKSPKFHAIQYASVSMRALNPATGQLFVDITPPRERWHEWVKYEPIILDHHESVKDFQGTFPYSVYGTKDDSGASLAYKYVFEAFYPFDSHEEDELIVHDDWQHFSHVAMIRDTWKKDNPLWDEARAQSHALKFFDTNKLIADSTNAIYDFSKLKEIGYLLSDKYDRDIKKFADGARISELSNDYRVAILNSFSVSDIGNYLIEKKDCDIVVGYFFFAEENKTKCVISVRSSDRFDSAKFAKIHGGGGHKKAAGFSITGGNSINQDDILQILEKYLLELY